MPRREGISWDCSFFPSLFACMLFVSSQALQIAEKDRIKVEHHTLQNVEKSSKSYTNSNQPKPNLPGSLRFGIF